MNPNEPKNNNKPKGTDHLVRELEAYKSLLKLTEDEVRFRDSQIKALEGVLDYYSESFTQSNDEQAAS